MVACLHSERGAGRRERRPARAAARGARHLRCPTRRARGGRDPRRRRRLADRRRRRGGRAGRRVRLRQDDGRARDRRARSTPGAGEIASTARASTQRPRAARRAIQLVFQDPFASLNPRRTVRSVLRELLKVHGLATGADAERRCAELLALVGLPAGGARPPPGGVLGRPASAHRDRARDRGRAAADRRRRAGLGARRLGRRRRSSRSSPSCAASSELGLLLISHNLAVVAALCDRVAVMYLGRVVESGPRAAVFADPRHPYTRALLDAAPRLRPEGAHGGRASATRRRRRGVAPGRLRVPRSLPARRGHLPARGSRAASGRRAARARRRLPLPRRRPTEVTIMMSIPEPASAPVSAGEYAADRGAAARRRRHAARRDPAAGRVDRRARGDGARRGRARRPRRERDHEPVRRGARTLARRGRGGRREHRRRACARGARLDEVDAALARGGADVVSLVHAEAATGARSELAAIAERAHASGALVLVDAVASVGAEPLEIDAWDLDLVALSAQKALGGPAGVCAVAVSERAWAAIEANPAAPRDSALSLLDWRERWIRAGRRELPQIPASPRDARARRGARADRGGGRLDARSGATSARATPRAPASAPPASRRGSRRRRWRRRSPRSLAARPACGRGAARAPRGAPRRRRRSSSPPGRSRRRRCASPTPARTRVWARSSRPSPASRSGCGSHGINADAGAALAGAVSGWQELSRLIAPAAMLTRPVLRRSPGLDSAPRERLEQADAVAFGIVEAGHRCRRPGSLGADPQASRPPARLARSDASMS